MLEDPESTFWLIHAQATLNYLAERVDYYSMGPITKSKVLEDIRGDWGRYSNYHSTVSEFERTSPTSCQFILEYTLMQGSKERHGKLLTSVTVTPESPQKIVSIKARVLSAK